VTHLRKSTTALSLLETLCRNNEETYHSPQNDTPTRWSSTHTHYDQEHAEDEKIIRDALCQ